MEYVTLNNGLKMPAGDFGGFHIKDQEVCTQVVNNAIKAGYRLLDTAQSYGNEVAVGRGINQIEVNPFSNRSRPRQSMRNTCFSFKPGLPLPRAKTASLPIQS